MDNKKSELKMGKDKNKRKNNQDKNAKTQQPLELNQKQLQQQGQSAQEKVENLKEPLIEGDRQQMKAEGQKMRQVEVEEEQSCVGVENRESGISKEEVKDKGEQVIQADLSQVQYRQQQNQSKISHEEQAQNQPIAQHQPAQTRLQVIPQPATSIEPILTCIEPILQSKPESTGEFRSQAIENIQKQAECSSKQIEIVETKQSEPNPVHSQQSPVHSQQPPVHSQQSPVHSQQSSQNSSITQPTVQQQQYSMSKSNCLSTVQQQPQRRTINLPAINEQTKPNQEQEESLLISQSDHSDFIQYLEVQLDSKLSAQVITRQAQGMDDLHSRAAQSILVGTVQERDIVRERKRDQILVGEIQNRQVKQTKPQPFLDYAKSQSILLDSQSESLLIQSNSTPNNSHHQNTSPVDQLQQKIQAVQSILLPSTNPIQSTTANQNPLPSSPTESLLISPQPSQTIPVLTPQAIQQLRAKNQEEQQKQKKLKDQQQHQKWTRLYEQKRKREEEQRKRHAEEMKRIKEEEEKRKLKQEKELIQKIDSQVKRELEKLKDVKKNVESETPLPVKLCISLAASLAVGGLTWLGKKNYKVTAISAVASLALAFVVQR